MSGNITENGKQIRPSFNYGHTTGDTYTHPEVAAQLLGSIRNVLEDIAGGQVLSCTVAGDIRRIRIALEKMAKPKQRKRK